MKTKMLVLACGCVVAAAIWIPKSVEAQPPQSKSQAIDWPIGSECVVTVETQAWMNTPTLPPGQASGFKPDYTVQGKVVYWGPDWVVVKDGTYENWISRDKVLSIRVSR